MEILGGGTIYMDGVKVDGVAIFHAEVSCEEVCNHSILPLGSSGTATFSVGEIGSRKFRTRLSLSQNFKSVKFGGKELTLNR